MAGSEVTLPQAGDEITSSWGQSVAKNLNGIQTGIVNVTFTSSTASANAPVTFPKPFASAPVIVIAPGQSANLWGVFHTVTPTGFIAVGRAPSSIASGTFALHWIAVGVLA